MKKKVIKKKIELEFREDKSDIIFCTECGEALENFSLSEDAKDFDAVIKNFHNCKKTGKFKGEMCSKLFMITPPIENKE